MCGWVHTYILYSLTLTIPHAGGGPAQAIYQSLVFGKPTIIEEKEGEEEEQRRLTEEEIGLLGTVNLEVYEAIPKVPTHHIDTPVDMTAFKTEMTEKDISKRSACVPLCACVHETESLYLYIFTHIHTHTLAGAFASTVGLGNRQRVMTPKDQLSIYTCGKLLETLKIR